MEKPFLIVRNSDDLIIGVRLMPDSDAGPVLPNTCLLAEHRLAHYAGEFTRSGRTETELPYFVDGEVVWTETSTLDELKRHKRAEITQSRLAADSGHFVFDGKAIRTADKDILDLLIADARWNKGKPLNWPGGWKTIDNSYVIINTKDEWDVFFIAMYDAGISNFNKSQELKNRIDNAKDAEALLGIVW